MVTQRITPFLLAALAVIIAFLVGSQCNRDRSMDVLLDRQVENNNIVKQWRNEDSAQVTQALSNYLTENQLRNSQDALVDTLRKELAGPMRNLTMATRILTTRIESLSIPVRDTSRVLPSGQVQQGYTFSYSRPPYLQYMKGVLFPDSVRIDYGITGKYLLEHRWMKPKRLFGPKELQLTMTAMDPAVVVDRIQNFYIVEKTPIWQKPGAAFGAGVLTGLAVDFIFAPR